MKLPFLFVTSGSGNGYHDGSFDQDDIDGENQDDLGNENAEVTFEEYLWMENEEEFDKIELLRLDEEALVENCLNDCGEEADETDEAIDNENGHWLAAQNEMVIMEYNNDVELSKMEINPHDVANSKLNPLAQEFFPSWLGRLK
ncbi:polyadenylate-binding protein-interacting protein 2B [Contarinia nasturtii]|uniref:polyadenylate-binding protein-interacting protein 2B n=1 Tax=Contarinia nasturtii TaxID=265458 RepID=UPI0012D3AA42|nr:polyadenylate-binding protein-interacting protein 2B [Contarinia nasturtii]XP_031631352.1 polyadenylate-binding protein-interacting protein 2B [Contarinia nasturtii]